MILEKEITVLVNKDYETLHKKLIENNFQIKEKFDLNDIYMIHKDVDVENVSKLDVLKQCILVRDIVGYTKSLTYKYKKYAPNGDILEQGKTECEINSIEDAVKFMEAINYKILFKIYDKCIVYANKKTEFVVQIVNDKYIFIELEDKCSNIDRFYNTIEEMKEDLDSYNLPYNKDNYFVKKAELVLNDTLEKNKQKKYCKRSLYE